MASRVKRGKRETVEEQKYTARAKGRGYICIKLAMVGPFGEAGWNDRVTFAEEGITVLFEFKRDDEEPRKLQSFRHRTLQRLKHHHAVVYYADEAWAILTKLIDRARAERVYKKLADQSIKTSKALDRRNKVQRLSKSGD